ncbi:MAG: hypothetical protein ABR579_07615 [Actinomycetota bacterium]
MTSGDVVAGCLLALGGAVLSYAVCSKRVKAQPRELMRTNYRGRPVAAVLGDGVVAAGAIGIAAAAVLARADATTVPIGRLAPAAAVVVAVMYLAGLWDDHKGDERPRGFKGHISAARGRMVTGGVVKLMAGAAAGTAAGFLVADGIGPIAVTAALVALSANLVNLFDRAPGRASKVALSAAVPLAVWGPPEWWIVGAGAFGGVVGSLPLDLGEKGTLGDAGANAVGAFVGLGLAVTLGPFGCWIAAVVLAALNVASERWSFSRIIESNRALDFLDRIGRK